MKTRENPEKAYENIFFSQRVSLLSFLKRGIDAMFEEMIIIYFCF
jgi:hypothetical protein